MRIAAAKWGIAASPAVRAPAGTLNPHCGMWYALRRTYKVHAPVRFLLAQPENPRQNLQMTTQVETQTSPEVRVHGVLPTHPAAKWNTDQAVPLSKQSFLDLLDGKTPLIKIPGFASKEVCEKLVAELTPRLCPYLHATGPAVQKVGLAQFEFQAQSEEDYKTRTGKGEPCRGILFALGWADRQSSEKQRYFEESAKIRPLHDDLAKAVGENVWARVITSLAALVPEWDVSVASEGESKDYFSGIFRCINNGTPIHCDWCPYDCNTEDWIINRITKQAVFNLYITPIRGGRTTLYDVQWTPDALRYRDPSSYGYYPDLVEGRKSCPFEPEVGDLFIFNSRNMHEVRAVDKATGGLGRIALASFMGLLPCEETKGKPRLMFWS